MADVVVTVTNPAGLFVVEVSRFGGANRLAATFPTGDQAAYPEAVARNRASAVARVAEFLSRNYADAEITHNY